MNGLWNPDTLRQSCEKSRSDKSVYTLSTHVLEMAGYQFINPSPARLDDIRKVHGCEHVESIKSKGRYDAAVLAARRRHLCRKAGPAGRACLRPDQAAGASCLRQPSLGAMLLQQHGHSSVEDPATGTKGADNRY
jgi:hypothetical protein